MSPVSGKQDIIRLLTYNRAAEDMDSEREEEKLRCNIQVGCGVYFTEEMSRLLTRFSAVERRGPEVRGTPLSDVEDI